MSTPWRQVLRDFGADEVVDLLDRGAARATLAWRRRKARRTAPELAGFPIGPGGRGGPGEEAWVCNVCGAVRPDYLIGVHSWAYDLSTGERVHRARPRGAASVAAIDIRYCLDRRACRNGTTAIARRWLQGWLRGVER